MNSKKPATSGEKKTLTERPPPGRGRFAPSPSGPLHFGSLIAATGSFLAARTTGSKWYVRIDDIDTPRVVRGATDDILRTLECYGLHWDGEIIYQSRCIERYQVALERLTELGLIYRCTCSRRELTRIAARGPAGMIYPGLCRSGPGRTDRTAALRLRTTDTDIVFHDAVQGEFRQQLESEVGDFVVRRADGLFTYQLAIVVDDADQDITHIVRGSDLLDSTPRQIYLQQLLDFPTPRYCHLPVAINELGNKLSKQTQATALDRRHPGPAMVAALAFLGQNPPRELERETPAGIWDWALRHWRPERIPAARQIPERLD